MGNPDTSWKRWLLNQVKIGIGERLEIRPETQAQRSSTGIGATQHSVPSREAEAGPLLQGTQRQPPTEELTSAQTGNLWPSSNHLGPAPCHSHTINTASPGKEAQTMNSPKHVSTSLCRRQEPCRLEMCSNPKRGQTTGRQNDSRCFVPKSETG